MRKKDLSTGDKVSIKGNKNIFYVREKHKPGLIGVSKTMQCPESQIYGVAVKDIKEIITHEKQDR